MANENNRRSLRSVDLRKQLLEMETALEEAKSKLHEVQNPELDGLRGWLSKPVEPNKPVWTYLIAPLLGVLAPLAAFFAAGVALWYNGEQVKAAQKKYLEDKRGAETKAITDKQNADASNLVLQKKTEEERKHAEAERKQDLDKFNRTLVLQQNTLLQSTRQFREQQELARQEYARSQRNFEITQGNERERFVKQLNTTRDQFRIDQAEQQFKNVQDRLASDDEKTRAAAALQLAELATIPYPQAKTIEPSNYEFPFQQKYYGFFPRVAQQFAVALTIEEKATVRSAIRDGLIVMTKFAKDRDKGHDILLVDMVNKLAEANRSSKRRFIAAMAEWSVEQNYPEVKVDMDDVQVSFLAGVTSFCLEDENTQSTLRALLAEGQDTDSTGKITRLSWYKRERLAYGSSRAKDISSGSKNGVNSKLLLPLRVSAGQLIDTRDSLAFGLRRLSRPTDFPAEQFTKVQVKMAKAMKELKKETDPYKRDKELKSLILESSNYDIDFWMKRERKLYLTGCFLAGAFLTRAELIGADLTNATMTGALLYDATLTGADLTNSTLTGVDLSGVTLTGALVWGSNLDKAISIPSTWEQANYYNILNMDNGEGEINYRKLVEAAYNKQH